MEEKEWRMEIASGVICCIGEMKVTAITNRYKGRKTSESFPSKFTSTHQIYTLHSPKSDPV
jgi:hypothetical protein